MERTFFNGISYLGQLIRIINFVHLYGEIEIRKGPAGIIGRLCVIGSDLNELNLTNLFSE